MKNRHLLTSLSLAALLFVGCAQTVSGDATDSVDAASNPAPVECSEAKKECCSEKAATECTEEQKAECTEGEADAEIN
jgi:hypothetical protein